MSQNQNDERLVALREVAEAGGSMEDVMNKLGIPTDDEKKKGSLSVFFSNMRTQYKVAAAAILDEKIKSGKTFTQAEKEEFVESVVKKFVPNLRRGKKASTDSVQQSIMSAFDELFGDSKVAE